jgi:hypothetical protein
MILGRLNVRKIPFPVVSPVMARLSSTQMNTIRKPRFSVLQGKCCFIEVDVGLHIRHCNAELDYLNEFCS